jgi:hypothetical protein
LFLEVRILKELAIHFREVRILKEIATTLMLRATPKENRVVPVVQGLKTKKAAPGRRTPQDYLEDVLPRFAQKSRVILGPPVSLSKSAGIWENRDLESIVDGGEPPDNHTTTPLLAPPTVLMYNSGSTNCKIF